MTPGDLVRFAMWGEFNWNEPWDKAEKPYIGLLVKYSKLMKTAHILYKGELIEVRGQLVEKAGKKDYEKNT